MLIYNKRRYVNDLKECYFYHTMELPGMGTINGDWDLRSNIKNYLGGVDFKGRRVLDVGCASGFLSFYMEHQGAKVVSFDLDKGGDWDMVPFAKWVEFERVSEARKAVIAKLNNAYWLAHRLLDSKAKVAYGSVYAIPDAIGPVDVAVYGSILLHLRDPFLALQNGLKLAKHTVIIAEPLRDRDPKAAEPFLGLLPNAATVEPKDAWWDIRPGWVVRALGVLGFEEVETSYHTQRYNGREEELYTVVGKRTHGHVIGSGVSIASVDSPNAIESMQGKKFLWIGDQPTKFFVYCDKDMVVLLDSEAVLMGPSLHQLRERTLCVRSADSMQELKITDRFTLSLRLRRGLNEVEVWCRDKPEILEQPNGDTRTLLLGLLNYQVKPADLVSRVLRGLA